MIIELPTDDPTQYVDEMRAMRAMFLRSSDWTQMPDSPLSDEQRAAWAVYRQALRDAPANWTPGPEWDAPEPPA